MDKPQASLSCEPHPKDGVKEIILSNNSLLFFAALALSSQCADGFQEESKLAAEIYQYGRYPGNRAGWPQCCDGGSFNPFSLLPACDSLGTLPISVFHLSCCTSCLGGGEEGECRQLFPHSRYRSAS